MKYLFLNISFICTFIFGINVYAQDIAIATLQQGDNMQVFYGAGALGSALEAADHGDLITLSAGNFSAANINKAVIIQGAGYVTDLENGRYPTVISNYFEIRLPDDAEGLIIEGVYHNSDINVRNPATLLTLKKCRSVNVRFEAKSKNCVIDQCRIGGLVPDAESENLYVKNSVINTIEGNSSSATLYVENCVIAGCIRNTITVLLKNNIISDVIDNYGFIRSSLTNSTVYNNVFIQGNADGAVIQSGNMSSDAETLFGYPIAYDDNKTYELTTASAAAFLGTDGKQVSIYGGATPFTNVPGNPQITKKEIDAEVPFDGKLKVNITVEAQN